MTLKDIHTKCFLIYEKKNTTSTNSNKHEIAL